MNKLRRTFMLCKLIQNMVESTRNEKLNRYTYALINYYLYGPNSIESKLAKVVPQALKRIANNEAAYSWLLEQFHTNYKDLNYSAEKAAYYDSKNYWNELLAHLEKVFLPKTSIEYHYQLEPLNKGIQVSDNRSTLFIENIE